MLPYVEYLGQRISENGLQKDVPRTWGREQEKAFRDMKAKLTSDCVLVYFHPTKELVLVCDDSLYGVGGVQPHRFEDHKERPVAFTSRSHVPAENIYAQVEKEILAFN